MLSHYYLKKDRIYIDFKKDCIFAYMKINSWQSKVFKDKPILFSKNKDRYPA
jgi:hypothetical protein